MDGIIEYDNYGLPICKICGKSFKKLGSHVWNKYSILTSDYKKQFGLDNNARIMSESSIQLASKRNKENYDLVVKDNLLSRGVKTRFKQGHKGRTKDKIRKQTAIRLSKQFDNRIQNKLIELNKEILINWEECNSKIKTKNKYEKI